MKISVISPVKNEAAFIGYSVMAVLPYIHEILYGVAPNDDNTLELLHHIKEEHAGDKLKIYEDTGVLPPMWDFDPMDIKAYNNSYNYLIQQATGDAVWFLHPDMVVTNPEAILTVPEGPLAWWTDVSSYARDLKTEIVAGRAKRWKNIHANQFGVHYFGGYGSNNEDFYHKEITGTAYRHYGDDFSEYPFEVQESGISINHYCELKTYERRYEKMVRCLRTQHPEIPENELRSIAKKHPRVTLERTSETFGNFQFAPSRRPVPAVFEKYAKEFSPFIKEEETVNA
jgi:hypothetical protein